MGMLIMLVTFLFAAACIAGTILLLFFHKASFIRYIAIVFAIWILFYGVFLVGASLLSRDQILSFGQPKYFCGFYFDCHLMASVKNVTLRKEYKGHNAKWMFYVANIEVASDARRAKLGLLAPRFTAIDNDGIFYDPIAEISTPREIFEKRIEFNERLVGEVVFDLPATALKPRLDISSDDSVDRVFESVLIGDEDSFLHKRTYLALEHK